jgi:hypothetical protein
MEQQMQTTSHNPARNEGESFSAYKARRAASNKTRRDAQRDPNHNLLNSRRKYRNDMRLSGTMGKRLRASDALMAAWAAKRVPNWKGARDEHGAYTQLTGGRKWLAGISAQRGF